MGDNPTSGSFAIRASGYWCWRPLCLAAQPKSVACAMRTISFFPAGAALFAAPAEFVYGGPSPGFRGFRAEPRFLVAGFDVFGLTLLFVSVAGFIALRHRSLLS